MPRTDHVTHLHEKRKFGHMHTPPTTPVILIRTLFRVYQVLFNIGGPALNQLNETAQRNKGKKRGVAAGLGLTAASMLAAQNADAAETIVEAAQKVNDNRISIIATVFVVSRECGCGSACFPSFA